MQRALIANAAFSAVSAIVMLAHFAHFAHFDPVTGPQRRASAGDGGLPIRRFDGDEAADDWLVRAANGGRAAGEFSVGTGKG